MAKETGILLGINQRRSGVRQKDHDGLHQNHPLKDSAHLKKRANLIQRRPLGRANWLTGGGSPLIPGEV